MPKLNDYLSIGQAAGYLGCSKDTLRRWDRSGKLTARRHPVTGFRLYVKEDLDAILVGVARPKAQTRRERKSDMKSRKGGC
jgi:DNA (cytosine-5)-methyltransferase 1